MTIVTACPRTIGECQLYRRLMELATPQDGLIDRLTAFLGAVEPQLDLVVAGPFREYTLHNPGHARKLVHLAEYLVEPSTINHMTVLDLTVFIMACHLHDLGMSLTADERSRIVSSTEFEEDMRQWPQLWDDLTATRARQAKVREGPDKLELEGRLFQLQEAGLASFLRKRHAERTRYIQLAARLKEVTGRADLFSLHGVSFENELISACESHNLDVGVLLDTTDAYTDRFPRAQPVGETTLNVQFCSGLLRLVDILDFDRERTPRVLFESLGIGHRDLPGAAATLKEWNKHMAVQSLRIDDDELVVFADSTHPAIERSIREFCAIIERELRDTAAVLRKNPAAVLDRYCLRAPLTARAQVRSVGYVYKDFAFTLDQTAISNLLMGEGLYLDPSTALRELVQNAIDACHVRTLCEKTSGYTPEVIVASETDKDDRHWIVVSDNGIGMDDAVLFEYFFRVGRSYYRSPEFDRLVRNSDSGFAPISRFGIGVVSVFMIADLLEVRTANAYSPRADTKSRVVRVDSRFGLAFVTEHASGPHGTEVRIRLTARSSFEFQRFCRQAAIYLRDTISRPAVPVRVDLADDSFTASADHYVSLRPNAREHLAQEHVLPVVLDIGRWSDKISGRVILFLYEGEDGLLRRNLVGGSAGRVDRFRPYLTEYHGNRLTVNGVVMHVKKLARVLRAKQGQIAGVIDVDVVGDSDVEYDVARQRLIGSTAGAVRIELRRAIASGLHDLGITAQTDARHRLDLEARTWPHDSGRVRPIDDEELLAAVSREVPEDPWPVGLHRAIAERVGVSPGLAYRALSTLLEAGRINKPERAERSDAEVLPEDDEQRRS